MGKKQFYADKIEAKDVIGFLRPKICLFVSSLAMTGYLLFNRPGIELIYVFIASFFGCAGIYSYNNLRDEKEDKINRGELNPLIKNKKAKWIIFSSLIIGCIASLNLTQTSIFFYLTSTITGIAYSGFRVKKYFFVKNLYTGFGITQVFLIGAKTLDLEIFIIYLLF